MNLNDILFNDILFNETENCIFIGITVVFDSGAPTCCFQFHPITEDFEQTANELLESVIKEAIQ